MELPTGAHQRQNHPTSDYTGHLPGGVGSHGVHQQEILEIFFMCDTLHHARGHRKGADPRRADHRIDLTPAQQIQQLGEQHTGGAIQYEGQQTKQQDEQRLLHEKLGADHRRANG